eukprot:Gb_37995 [translate_table: standard]
MGYNLQRQERRFRYLLDERFGRGVGSQAGLETWHWTVGLVENILINKYYGGVSRSSFMWDSQLYRSGSVLWKNIIQGLPLIRTHLSWLLGDGRSFHLFDKGFLFRISLHKEH